MPFTSYTFLRIFNRCKNYYVFLQTSLNHTSWIMLAKRQKYRHSRTAFNLIAFATLHQCNTLQCFYQLFEFSLSAPRGGLTHQAKVGDCLGPPNARGPLKCFSYTRCTLSVTICTVEVYGVYYHDNSLRVRVERASSVSCL